MNNSSAELFKRPPILRSTNTNPHRLSVEPKKDTLASEEEARKFASIAGQAKEAVQAVDSHYLDQRQKAQVIDTFVKLISIRSPSGAEGPIRDELKRTLETLGAREIDCRKGDLRAPFNLVMELAASEDLKNAPAILLNAHMDTIGGTAGDDKCTPERLEFDIVKSDFYHRDNGSYGADDKSGVTMVVEALRTLKRGYWEKGHSHRRILVVLTAQEEYWRQGAEYLATHSRELFDNLDYSFTVDGSLWGHWGTNDYLLSATSSWTQIHARSSWTGFVRNLRIIDQAFRPATSFQTNTDWPDGLLPGLFPGGREEARKQRRRPCP